MLVEGRSSGKVFAALFILSLIGQSFNSMPTEYPNSTIEGNFSEETEKLSTPSRIERSHEGPDLIMLEPRGRPSDGSPEDPLFRPYFGDDTEKNVTFQLRKTARLHCRIIQLGTRVVSWVRQRDLHILTVGTYTYTTDQRFTSIHLQDSEDWTLEIRDLRREDAGIYECQISYEPKMSLAIKLNVIVVEARIAEGPSMYVKSGGSVNLTCIVTDVVGTAFVFWYHEGEVIDDAKKTTGISISTDLGPTTISRLYIPSAKPSDTGNYTCFPSYSEAATIQLQVLIDEKPAAMQHGSNKGFYLGGASKVIIILVLSLILLY